MYVIRVQCTMDNHLGKIEKIYMTRISVDKSERRATFHFLRGFGSFFKKGGAVRVVRPASSTRCLPSSCFVY